eukprot:CAMPEP_0204564424 /NCGR_PEP_ID=MMETSP0661-20131031/34876_1 /ASSEMBLY_ACC=CAM_ASM_000606 /TAXON_ID=109239 /ORGANISM="Alexandrium margalefi, Strain AMGDE01CS-322" /LENGTH=441 /DNA_ID=CAMNT_0051572063 /DNA_START=89 /DNA_END=1414 /DNA_ORIENTATION=-
MPPDKGLRPGLALVTILKGMIGAGILALPQVFGKVRLALAVPGYLVVTAVCAFSVWRLIQCKAMLRGSEKEVLVGCRDQSDYEDASSLSEGEPSSRARREDDFGLGPLAQVGHRTLGPGGVVLAGLGVVVSQLGFCVAYVGVAVETLRGPHLLGPRVSPLLLRLALGLVLGALCLIRRLEHIAKLSGLALFVYCYLLWALVWHGSHALLSADEPPAPSVWTPVDWHGMGVWFGTAIFAQEAIVISQYVYDEMQLENPRDFLPVLVGSFSICGGVSAFVGGFGYFCYGDEIADVFYLNFPAGSIDVALAEGVLCVVLLASFVLQLYPVVSFAEAMASRLKEAGQSGSSSGSDTAVVQWAPAVAVRWGLVLLVSLAAAGIPNLSCVSGYSGSFAMSLIGFFLPPLCHIKAHRCELSPLDWAGNLLLLSAGCAAVVFGVLTTSC